MTRLGSRPVARRDSRRRRHPWRNTPGASANLRGPRRALTLDEQIEIQRLMREARPSHSRSRTAALLATRYGVSSRTIWRYAESVPVPAGLEYLAMRVREWAEERDLRLTHDDLMTLMLVISRHRDTQARTVAA